MDNYQQNLKEETIYLKETLTFIEQELLRMNDALADKKRNLIAARKEMWEDSVHFTDDFMKLTEMNQYLAEVSNHSANYDSMFKHIANYERLLSSPYFGRFDFQEAGENPEKIYIGLHNVMDMKTHTVYVYDWRAPISSMFYQYEPGEASYAAQVGTISGNILLKRQYKIKNAQLYYFFDCSIRISDEILQEVLSHNASPKMKSIVETIQKEQDLIIRDTQNALLIVQGVAGSGKTSIALHRIAFLLYEGMQLKSNNILIVSPNALFSKYIANVLPELGEENMLQTTFEDIASTLLTGSMHTETRSMQLEYLITMQNTKEALCKKHSISFKGSRVFAQILDRFIQYFERHLIDFEDVYFEGQMIINKQLLKNRFLNNKTNMPASKRLERIEKMLLDKIHPLRKNRLAKIIDIVKNNPDHQFQIKPYSRLLSVKEATAFRHKLQHFTKFDFYELYKTLFNTPGLLQKLAKGLPLPEDMDEIIAETREKLNSAHAAYEDTWPLLYLKLKLEGSQLFSSIRQVVIDEAQDYYPLQYEVFKLLFHQVRYTVLGDVHQSIERDTDKSIYDTIAEILGSQKTLKLFLNKSYRSSFEITAFNQKLLDKNDDVISFERHEAKPLIIAENSEAAMLQRISEDIAGYYAQGYESIAVICKTQEEAEEVHNCLKNRATAKLLDISGDEIEKGTLVIPVHMAKGLEFDVVLVYGTDSRRYFTDFDKKLLYIACTRTLHRLSLYHTGQQSPLI